MAEPPVTRYTKGEEPPSRRLQKRGAHPSEANEHPRRQAGRSADPDRLSHPHPRSHHHSRPCPYQLQWGGRIRRPAGWTGPHGRGTRPPPPAPRGGGLFGRGRGGGVGREDRPYLLRPLGGVGERLPRRDSHGDRVSIGRQRRLGRFFPLCRPGGLGLRHPQRPLLFPQDGGLALEPGHRPGGSVCSPPTSSPLSSRQKPLPTPRAIRWSSP